MPEATEPQLTEAQVDELSTQVDRFLSSLTFGEPERGNRYVESEDADYFEQGIDNEYDAYDLLRQLPALTRDWRAMKARIEQLNYDYLAVSRVWAALGITEYTGKAVDEHVSKVVAENAALREQLAQLRSALEPLSQNGRLFTFHRNVEEGDYFECGLCHQEAKRWDEIQHTPTCRIEIAKKALEATA